MKWVKRFFWLAVCIAIAAAAALAYGLERMRIPPRQLAPYLLHRAEGHNPYLVDLIAGASRELMRLDRGQPQVHRVQAWRIGAQPAPARATGAHLDAVVLVSTAAELFQAVAQARPGNAITLLPGTYRLEGHGGSVNINQAGTQAAPITLRAEQPDTVFLEFNMGEGFKVSAPYWTFENLHLRGVCPRQEFCEHAFHIIGKATHFIARNNTIVDFNAHFKINGEGGDFPDDGLIDGNTLANSAARQTDSPVTPIDLVAASGWRISHNLISDFIKARGNRTSYGAFVKGGGSGNRIEQNIVLCEHLLQNFPGARVGLSLGGGGTGRAYCRDQRCITEQDGGVIQSNLIASCSDDGIYLNRAATSKIMHNTLIDTGGVSVRFPETSADMQGNLIDSVIRVRDDGLLRASDNMTTSALQLYRGAHPVRALFADAGGMNYRWKTRPPVNPDPDQPPDLCGAARPPRPSYGAFEDFAACLRQ